MSFIEQMCFCPLVETTLNDLCKQQIRENMYIIEKCYIFEVRYYLAVYEDQYF